MASPEVTSALGGIMKAPSQEKPARYNSLLSNILSDSPADALVTNLKAYTHTLLDEQLGVVVLRPLITSLVDAFRTLKDADTKIEVLPYFIDLLAPKGAQYEENDTAAKQILAGAYEEQGEYIKSAQTLSRIPLDSTQKKLSADDKARIWIRIVRCYLEEDDTTNAFTHLNKIKNVIHSVHDTETKLMFQLSQARIYDSQRAFLDAAQAYYTISLEPLIDEEERLHTLSAAVVCAVLAPAGPTRAKMLAKLYKDERASQIEHYAILEKIFFDRIMPPEEVKAFAAKLSPHHLAKTADGSTVLDKAVLEHNLLGVSRIYNNIGIDRLGELLGIDPDRAEENAARMLEQGRLAGSIDQIDRYIYFEGEGSGQRKTGHTNIGRKELRKWDSNVEGLAEDVEKVTMMIQKEHPVGSAPRFPVSD
jgi:COP9 signalosome complex subunit 4